MYDYNYSILKSVKEFMNIIYNIEKSNEKDKENIGLKLKDTL